MSKWFECKVRYDKVQENGTNKKVTEPYLVDAVTFTEAEARIIEELTPYMSGEFEVTNIKRANYAEVVPADDADRWYECKVEFVTLDERTATEKKTASRLLVAANDLHDAVKRFDKAMSGTMADFNALCIKETPLMDVYPAKLADKCATAVEKKPINNPVPLPRRNARQGA